MNERKEVFMRIPVLFIAGAVLWVWKWLVYTFIFINFFYTLFAGRRHKEIAEMSETWNTQWYVFQRYIIFQSNRRPFPFGSLEKNISRHDLKLTMRRPKKKKKR